MPDMIRVPLGSTPKEAVTNYEKSQRSVVVVKAVLRTMFGDDASITEVQDGADLRVETLGEVFDFEVKGTPKKGTAARQSLLVNSPRSDERLRSGEVTLVRVSRLNTEEPRVTFLKREEYRIETRPYGTYVKLLVSTDF